MDDLLLSSASDCVVVNTLSTVLRDVCQSDDIRNRLTLSARCLQVLYEGFRQMQNSACIKFSESCPEEKFFASLRHLHDIVQNAKELKIFNSGETIRGHINCADFSGISSLEVKCIPFCHIYGLSKIAPNLVTLSCTGSISNIQKLFEQCGADSFRASDVLWSKLKEVHLTYNNLRSLDNSLRLVSQLCHLDLSHNSLQSTDDFLQVLQYLETLNLSFNSLRVFPQMPRASNRHLTTLNLRNNLLTSLRGLENLFCLRFLDVSNNLLPATKTLHNLKALLLLHCLVLAGNPVSYHPSYRSIVISCLHPAVLSQITFDGQPLTRKERMQFQQIQTGSTAVNSQVIPDFLESVDESVSSICDSLSDSRRTSRRKLRPRLVEIVNQDDSTERHASNERFENSVDFLDSTQINSVQSTELDSTGSERCDSGPRVLKSRVSSKTNSSRKLKLESRFSPGHSSFNESLEVDGIDNNILISGNRLCLVNGETEDKEDKVNVLTQCKQESTTIQPNLDSVTRTDRSESEHKIYRHPDTQLGNENKAYNDAVACDPTVISHDSSVCISDSSLIAKEGLSVKDGAAAAAALEENTSHALGVQSAVTDSSLYDAASSIPDQPVSSVVEIFQPDSAVTKSVAIRNNSVATTGVSPCWSTAGDSSVSHHQSPAVISRSFSCIVSDSVARKNNDQFLDDVYRSLDVDSLNETWQPDVDKSSLDSLAMEDVTLESLIDNGFEGDFLIYLLGRSRDVNADNKYIVSVIDNWLYFRSAKDIVERLDLRTLLAVQKMADSLSDYIEKRDTKISFDPSFPGPVVRLLFDTYRQDSRERLFAMKDLRQGKQLASLLKSFVKSKTSKKMQCLKCDAHFDESEGKLATKVSFKRDMTSMSKFPDNCDLSLHCPKCDSHFVIEVLERPTSKELSRSVANKSHTMMQLNRTQSVAGNKDARKKEKRRKQRLQSVAQLSSVAQTNSGSPSSSFSFSFLRRRSTNEHSLLSGEDQQNADTKSVDELKSDMAAVEAVQFFIDPSDQ